MVKSKNHWQEQQQQNRSPKAHDVVEEKVQYEVEDQDLVEKQKEKVECSRQRLLRLYL